MRNIFSFALAATLLASPVAVMASNKTDKIAKLEAKADAIQAKQDALQQKAGNSPSAAQQAKLDKLAGRYASVSAQEQKVRDRIPASH